MQTRKPRILLIALAFIAFISLGLPDGLLGVAWPSIRTYFNLSLDALGPLLISFTAGYLVSSFSSGQMLARLSVGTLLALSCLATATALLGFALTPIWWIMVTLGLLLGAGGGAIDTGLNTYVATQFSARTLNWLHACYGIGATLGPLIMTAVLASGLPWQGGYLIVGVVQLSLALCFALTRRLWAAPTTTEAAPSEQIRAASALATLRLPTAWLSIALFWLYTGVEVTAGQWAYSVFTESRSISTTTAGQWVSVYWGALTVGRIVFGALVARVSVERLLRLCIIGIVGGAALFWLNFTPLLSFLGLAFIGFMLAPIFPSLIAQTPQRLGPRHTANAVGFQIAAAMLGGSMLPTIVGVLARNFGLESIGLFILVVSLGLFTLHEILLLASAGNRSVSARPDPQLH